jgi:enamine deaminase RidA (YjgF/YER057c/UK114 family)
MLKKAFDSIPAIGESHGVLAGNRLYMAGQVSMAEDGAVVGAGSVETQTRQCIAMVERVLRAYSASLSDLIEATAYVKDVDDVPAVQGVIRSLVSETNPPAITVVIASPPSDAWLVEVKAIAGLGAWS